MKLNLKKDLTPVKIYQKQYFDKRGYPYKKSMGIDELVEELKKWEKRLFVYQHITIIITYN